MLFFLSLFTCGCSVLALFVEKAFFTLFYCLCSFVKDQSTLFMWVYLWFCTIPLISLFFCQYHPVLITVALYWVKSGSVCPPDFLFFNNYLAFLGFFASPYKTVESVCWYLWNLLGFWLLLHLNAIALPCWQYGFPICEHGVSLHLFHY